MYMEGMAFINMSVCYISGNNADFHYTCYLGGGEGGFSLSFKSKLNHSFSRKHITTFTQDTLLHFLKTANHTNNLYIPINMDVINVVFFFTCRTAG